MSDTKRMAEHLLDELGAAIDALDRCADLERELAAKAEECERWKRAARKIEQALLPDPSDERDISISWLSKTIHAALREGK